MQQHCHRCGGELSPSTDTTPFCPHCGAPQLYLPDYEDAGSAASTSTATPPPPHPRQIEWQTAIRCGAVVSAVAVLFCAASFGLPNIGLLSVCWILSASMITLTLYQRRRPVARMDARIGARIGLTTGLLLVASLGLTLAIAGVVARFGLHNMAQFDAESAQWWAQARTAFVARQPMPPEMLRFFDLPEFHAGIMLTGAGAYAAILVILSTFSGALGGLLRARHTPAV